MSFSVVTGAPVPSCLFDSLSLGSFSELAASFSVLTAPFSALTLFLFIVLSESCSIRVDAGSICVTSPVFSVLTELKSVEMGPFDGVSFTVLSDYIDVSFFGFSILMTIPLFSLGDISLSVLVSVKVDFSGLMFFVSFSVSGSSLSLNKSSS